MLQKINCIGGNLNSNYKKIMPEGFLTGHTMQIFSNQCDTLLCSGKAGGINWQGKPEWELNATMWLPWLFLTGFYSTFLMQYFFMACLQADV
jgi:hypothetical protein